MPDTKPRKPPTCGRCRGMLRDLRRAPGKWPPDDEIERLDKHLALRFPGALIALCGTRPAPLFDDPALRRLFGDA